ncbi:hypothetical protein [Pasteurella sp. PK-2025]|uniref:hypothetical protein n=1 Tax=unclassified Pasteurella TaxID=2621516 RepID=UPI003C785B52
MKKTFLILTALFAFCLTGCVSRPQLAAPQQIVHNKHTYVLAAQQDLGQIARFFYLEEQDNVEKWKSAVELLFDRNPMQNSLQDRISLRQRVYRNTGVKHFKLQEKADSLYAFVIYEPTVKNNDWQVDVARGKNVLNCGFVQYQYSFKVPKTKKIRNMSNEKVARYLKKYVAEKELKQLSQHDWQWGCQ